MPIDFYKLLKDNDFLRDMPPFTISSRDSDKFITYNKQKNRLDNIAGNIYQDDTLWRVILWANPQYFIEFDIPDNTVIRVPFPMRDVVDEVKMKIISKRNKA